MLPEQPPDWRLEDFESMLDAWADIEKPPPDLLIIINLWVMTRLDDPLAGTQRMREFPDGWVFAIIPGTFNGDHAVTCTFRVDAKTGLVKCSYFGYLAPPYGSA